ncbi:FAD:protein FMN transferase [Aerococcaceae bacterium zg-BR22]|uniref:FAD:protein FMN transferase n=1 Tax=Aerococcaceae bacterium zg-1292 TaxID=2774330 RepID=UPI004063DC08|nr:FAD:protein FMN transferase [Aerococcaceae bacterium zg-BR22]
MKKRIKRLLLSTSVLALIAAPGVTPIYAQEVTSGASAKLSNTPLKVVKDPLVRSESMLHTAIQIQIFHENQEAVMDKAIDYIKRMEKLMSTNLEGSDVYRINQAAGKEAVKVAPETFEVIKKALEISELSEGKFDITIGAVSNLWRIGSDDARVPEKSEIAAALKKIDYKKVTIDEKNQTVKLEEEGMAIELGGISKGYIGSGIVKYFAQAGITTAIVNLGGNVVVMGSSPANDEGWNVGVQDPDEVRGTVVGTRRIKDYAVITSGIYERFLEKDGVKYHHILDPKTGYPLENDISGVTVFAPTSVDGDALSTTLFLFGIKEGKAFVEKLKGVEAVFIDKSHGVHLTSGLKDSFVLKNEEYHLVNE